MSGRLRRWLNRLRGREHDGEEAGESFVTQCTREVYLADGPFAGRRIMIDEDAAFLRLTGINLEPVLYVASPNDPHQWRLARP